MMMMSFCHCFPEMVVWVEVCGVGVSEVVGKGVWALIHEVVKCSEAMK